MAKKTIKDPVCGMMVDRSKAKLEKMQGQTYGFCSDECCNKFRSNPESYSSFLA